jgi:hypothetical protein
LLSQLGNIWSPYFFPSDDGPRYVMAMLLMTGFSAVSIIASLLMKFLLKKDNKKLLIQAEIDGRRVQLYTTNRRQTLRVEVFAFVWGLTLRIGRGESKCLYCQSRSVCFNIVKSHSDLNC